MKIVICSDSFKGSLNSSRVADIVARSAIRVFPDAEVDKVAIADGGEGSLEAMVSSAGGQIYSFFVRDPLGRPVQGQMLQLPSGDAFIEMASASGLPLLKDSERNPLLASTFGTGELIGRALDWGCRKIYIAIGGSATNDGGAGMLRALGAQFLDDSNRPLPDGGGYLKSLNRIDLDGLDERLSSTQIIVLSDVNNPLCGPNGASAVYGPQKGADPSMVEALDGALCRLSEVAQRQSGKDLANVPGAGAAGGLGYGLMCFLNAELHSGIETMLELIGFESHIEGADLIITGEGKLDEQSAMGKAISGIAACAHKQNIPIVAIAGSLGAGAAQALTAMGLSAACACVNAPMNVAKALENAQPLLEQASTQMLQAIRLGMQMKQ